MEKAEKAAGGIQVQFRTNGAYLPAHAHSEIEIIYLLNGEAAVLLEGESHRLRAGDFILIDSGRIHESCCARAYMFVDIKMDEMLFESYLDRRRDFMLLASREELTEETAPAYEAACSLLRELVPLYIRQTEGFRLARDAIVLKLMGILLGSFAVPVTASDAYSAVSGRSRMHEIMEFIEQNYQRPVSLEEIAGHFGLSREYFSRMFRQNVGVTFTRHVNHVRLMHIYHDLCATDEPVMALAEKHGFTNYRLFTTMFRQLFGCTPRALRRLQREQERAAGRESADRCASGSLKEAVQRVDA